MDGSNTSFHYSDKKSFTIKLFILFGLWIVSFIPVYPSLVGTWLNHGDNSHGILVPLVSLYFVWQMRDRLKLVKISTTIWGVLILVISMGLYLLSFAGGIDVMARCMIVFSLVGLVCSGVTH